MTQSVLARWRAAMSALVVALASIGLVVVPASADINGFHWESDWGTLGGWVDNQCTADPLFKIAVNTKSDGSGSKAKICHNILDLRNVPRGAAGTEDFDNHISAWYVYCNGQPDYHYYYVQFYMGYSYTTLANYGSVILAPYACGFWASVYSTEDDTYSSVRRLS